MYFKDLPPARWMRRPVLDLGAAMMCQLHKLQTFQSSRAPNHRCFWWSSITKASSAPEKPSHIQITTSGHLRSSAPTSSEDRSPAPKCFSVEPVWSDNLANAQLKTDTLNVRPPREPMMEPTVQQDRHDMVRLESVQLASCSDGTTKASLTCNLNVSVKADYPGTNVCSPRSFIYIYMCDVATYSSRCFQYLHLKIESCS